MDKKLETEIKKRRSFAIIAHPDAGKTTLTEKLLLYGGAIRLAGHVRARKDRKSTRSDWMTLEQERGISISTAALQFDYNGYVMNLLDTPGHKDFSEDTYRTLMAVDSVIMLLDAGRGVEEQTIKLFHICRERNLPIFTFVNKMDMPALNPFEIIDNIEKVLGIPAIPMVWPMGSGRDFRGYFDLSTQEVHKFERTTGGAYIAPERTTGIDDASIQDILGDTDYKAFHEGAQIALHAIRPFEINEFLKGNITPVFFGSAITNFGIQHLLDKFIEFSPSPGDIVQPDGSILSAERPEFAAFVFKIQANMNKLHRDRVAFIRIMSGHFERGMGVFVPRLKKEVKLSSPVAFFGQERNVIDEAYPGDIIGLVSPGLYRLGDILCTGQPPQFQPLPKFAPDLYAKIIPTDTAKIKHFKKGVAELADEGVIQLFNIHEQTPLVGVVGELQFEVFKYRLEDEYGAPCRIEQLSFGCSRWISKEDSAKISRFDKLVTDENGNTVVLFENRFRLKTFQENNPDVILLTHPPRSL